MGDVRLKPAKRGIADLIQWATDQLDFLSTGLDIAAFDFLLELLHHVGNALQPRIDRERAAAKRRAIINSRPIHPSRLAATVLRAA